MAEKRNGGDDQSKRYKLANLMVSLPKTYHEKPPLIKFRDTSDSITGPRRAKMLILAQRVRQYMVTKAMQVLNDVYK